MAQRPPQSESSEHIDHEGGQSRTVEEILEPDVDAHASESPQCSAERDRQEFSNFHTCEATRLAPKLE